MLAERAGQLKEKIGALGDIDVAELSRKATRAVKNNPGKALLVAAGLGIGLGTGLRAMRR